MNDTMVTVIVPVYNTAPYLSRCINSILCQSFSKIELILIDDGSTDNSLDICNQYREKDERIKVFHKENGGVCSARNKGLKEMHGDFFMFLDSDDAIEKNIMEDTMNCFVRYPQADMVVFGWKKIFINEKNEEYLPANEFVSDMENATKKLLTNYNGVGGGYPNKIWKTSAFHGTVPEYNETLFYFEDMEWMTRMFLSINSFACLDTNGYLYYIRDDSTTFRNDNEERKEYGYHLSAQQITVNLQSYPQLYQWYCELYYPEIVNGVINSWKKRYSTLGKWLLTQLEKKTMFIFKSNNIAFKIKFRCAILSLLCWIH